MRHPISKILYGISVVIYSFSWFIAIGVKDNVMLIFKDLGMPLPLPTIIFLEYGTMIVAATMIIITTIGAMEFSNMKQIVKVRINMISSFIGLLIIMYYIISIFIPFVQVTKAIGAQAQ